jgi:hypothetical protein
MRFGNQENRMTHLDVYRLFGGVKPRRLACRQDRTNTNLAERIGLIGDNGSAPGDLSVKSEKIFITDRAWRIMRECFAGSQPP